MTADLGFEGADVLIEEAYGTTVAAAAEGIVTEAGPVSEFSNETAIWRVNQLAKGLVAAMFAGTAAAAGWLGRWFAGTRNTPAPQPPRPSPNRTAPLITAVGPDAPAVPPGPLTGALSAIRETLTAVQDVITRTTAAILTQMWRIVHVAIPAAIHSFDVISAAPGYRMAHDIKTVAPRLARKARLAGMPDAAAALGQVPHDFPVTVASVLAVVAAATEGVTRVVDDCVITDCQDKKAWQQVNDHLDLGLGALAGLGLLKYMTRDPEGAARWTVDHGLTIIGEALQAGAAAAAVTGGLETAAYTGLLAEFFLHPAGTIKVIEDILLDP